MKTLPVVTFLAALVAFVLLPHTLGIAGSLLFSAGLISLFAADCNRTIKPLAVRHGLVEFPRAPRGIPAYDLAA